jgi:GT2 family glycosyltransferase
MTNTVPVAVIIPTYNRGMAVISVLEKILECDPQPAEIWVHVDLADGALERVLHRRFPDVGVLTSSVRLGPGGGRHQCLLACTTPFAVSFDDDSYPVDADFFFSVSQLFSEHPHVAIFGASISHRYETPKYRTGDLISCPRYIGCGYAVRMAAYRRVRGHIPRPVPYRMEECDLSLQLFANGWQIYEAKDLRVFHDTDLKHHRSSEVTSGIIANVGLYAFLHYPLTAWPLGAAQVANQIAYVIRMGRLRGICSGLLSIPAECYRNRQYRKPVTWPTLKRFRHFLKFPFHPVS